MEEAKNDQVHAYPNVREPRLTTLVRRLTPQFSVHLGRGGSIRSPLKTAPPQQKSNDGELENRNQEEP